MAKYSFEGDLVDLKGTNLHDSALVEADVEAGRFVKVGVDQTKVLYATSGTASGLGVAIQKRESGDARPLTYTYRGEVNVLSAVSGIAVADWVEVQNTLGEIGPFVGSVAFSGSALTPNDLRKIVGKALEASTASGQAIRIHVGGLVL